jgi:HEPN superfamily AbiU2-like protein
MKINIRNSSEFNRLLTALVDELIDAQIHFTLYENLVAAMPEYHSEFNESWTFWSLTLEAHLDSAILRLAKSYDQYGKRTLNLPNLLETIKANLHLFAEQNFRERLKDNSFVDSLAAMPRTPDAAQLDEDIASVSPPNPRVKKLILWRNNFYAHRSVDHVLNPNGFASITPLTVQDIGTLLANGVTIVNRYNGLFSATFTSTNIVGRSDYVNLLQSVRESLNAREARIQEEIKHFS